MTPPRVQNWAWWQRRMGVEPTRDRAERPPSRFEDGETHRDLYTSMTIVDLLRGCILPSLVMLVKLVKLANAKLSTSFFALVE